jgi:magnesium-transporting ATPase (P-type)
VNLVPMREKRGTESRSIVVTWPYQKACITGNVTTAQDVAGVRADALRKMAGARSSAKLLHSGRVAQRESTRFTREGSLVRSQPRPSPRAALQVRAILTGVALDQLDDAALAATLPQTTIFARVTPEQKSRVIKAQRALGPTVGFLGDGVNDAVALHDADVGISVDTATDVAKDAAGIVLLAKDLDILVGGVVEGRRIFANTIKYVLMGTSSNFGNVFSAGAASLFLSFLPLLPTQILLNNLLYDVGQLTIPTDNVDEEQLRRPSHWDTQLIRRFMPLSDRSAPPSTSPRSRSWSSASTRARRCSAPAGS